MLTPQEVAEKHLTAVKGGDPSQMAEDYADDAVLVRGNDVYTGKEEIFEYFNGVPERLGSGVIEFLKLEGYVLMREFSLAENLLDAKSVELLLCTVNAAEFSARFVNVHANGARKAGASEAEIVESVLCAIPVAGVASWLPGADGIMEGRTGS